ncbi:hypothetical protein KC19_5G018200 [Ceratodon purpureus]|uniref:Secreted protein n=1 Tax=Ceratodon purpureus TaxID=3225 RepID=A0A8T0HXM9_CERPU|nr:hypothetical protein KC19_5G018200 [Ceratodon purpureus]
MGLRISFWCIKVIACLVKVEGEQQQVQGSGVPTRRELFSKWRGALVVTLSSEWCCIEPGDFFVRKWCRKDTGYFLDNLRDQKVDNGVFLCIS